MSNRLIYIYIFDSELISLGHRWLHIHIQWSEYNNTLYIYIMIKYFKII